MRTTRLKSSTSVRLLAVVVGVLVFALPLLGLNCEVACARGAARAATAKGSQAPAEQCASHKDAAHGRPSGDPPVPDRCGHHSESVAVKRVPDDAASGFKTPMPAGLVHTPKACAFDQSADSSALAERAAGPRPAVARSSVLRL